MSKMPSQLTKPDLSLQPHQWFNQGVTGCQPVFITSACYIKRVVSKQGDAHSQHPHTEYLEQSATSVNLNNNTLGQTKPFKSCWRGKEHLVKLKCQKI